jgi:hypothetical protein
MSTEGERKHFVCRIIDNGEEFYCIWYSGEVDGVATEDGKGLLWRNEDGARDYAHRQGWILASDKPATFDLSYISTVEANPSMFHPKESLDIWNLFSDIGKSVGYAEFSGQDSNASELHARLSALSLSHILGSEPKQLTVSEIEGIVAVLQLGKAMLKERCLVLG